jgi:hypothetical protein
MSIKKKEKVNLNRDQIFTHLDEELDSALNELADTNDKIDSILNEEEMEPETETVSEIEEPEAPDANATTE